MLSLIMEISFIRSNSIPPNKLDLRINPFSILIINQLTHKKMR